MPAGPLSWVVRRPGGRGSLATARCRPVVSLGTIADVALGESTPMHTVKYVHWQEGDAWLGYLQDYPDYWTQGETRDDLLDHLKDLYLDLAGGHIPGARKVGELVVP